MEWRFGFFFIEDNFQNDPSVTVIKDQTFLLPKWSTASKKHSKKSTKPPSKNFFSSNILESIGALVIRYSTGIRVFWDKRVAILYSLWTWFFGTGSKDNLHLLFSCLTRFPPVNFRNSDNFNYFTLASQLQLLNWQTPNDNFWNKFEIQAFEQIGNVKKAQIHILFRQNLEKRFVDFLTKSRNSCY